MTSTGSRGHHTSHFAPTPAMGGPLVVTSAGGSTVATDGMRETIERVRVLRDDLHTAIGALHRAALVPGRPDLEAARAALVTAHDLAVDLHRGLQHAVENYTHAEETADRLFDTSAAAAGAALGWLGPLVIGAAGALGPLPLLGLALNGAAMGKPIGDAIQANPRWLSNPGFVRFVRGVADGMDEFVLGGVLPAPIAFAVGASRPPGVGVETSGRVLMGAGESVGLLQESAVEVQRVGRRTVGAPPSGSAERLDRVPEGNQVRIEQYSAPGLPDRYVVYVGPTETFSPLPEGEPWDLASNVGGVAGLDVGSIRATEAAMRDAGIAPDSEVQLVGFSQGGMVAARVAADGGWNAVGLQTFGAPAGNVALPDGIQGMAVRNAEDFIPALAGPQLDHHLLQVERQVYADPGQMPTDQAVPGHQRVSYDATAQAIDQARSPQVREQSRALDAFTADYAAAPGSSITEYTYHATRLGQPAESTR